jgi:PadR family transcriptional regulator, regulatory protein AphA
MSLRHALLGALADHPRTGYALLKHFEQSLAYAWPASHSQIYPELARLLEEGLIEEVESGPRKSRTYALTSSGLEEIRRWLRETTPDRRVRSDAALRTFFLWLLEPEEAREQLERESEHWRRVLEELEAIEAEPAGRSRKERAFRLALEGGIRAARTRLEWIEWALAQVRSSAWRAAASAPATAPVEAASGSDLRRAVDERRAPRGS